GDPSAEAFGVVRRLAVVGGADDNQGPFVGQHARVIIKRAERDRVATVGSVLGDLVRHSFGGAEVGPEQNHEWGVMSLPGRLWPRLRLSGLPVGRRGGDGDGCGSGGSTGALVDLDEQSVGL